MDVQAAIGKLVDTWCARRALRPLRVLLPSWPPPNGFTNEWQELWAAMRHVRATCREELDQNGESEEVNAVVAELSRRLFPGKPLHEIEQAAEQITAASFGDQRA